MIMLINVGDNFLESIIAYGPVELRTTKASSLGHGLVVDCGCVGGFGECVVQPCTFITEFLVDSSLCFSTVFI